MIKLSDKSSPLNSTTIYPKYDHTLCSVLSPKTKWPYLLYLCLEPILFFSFFFSKVRILIITWVHQHHHDLYFMWPSPSMSATYLHHFGLDQPISKPHLEHRVSPNRFHQLTKTKLGLSPNCPHLRWVILSYEVCDLVHHGLAWSWSGFALVMGFFSDVWALFCLVLGLFTP